MRGKDFIQTFHSRHPGATTVAFGDARDARGRSPYELLAALADDVPRGGEVLDVACGDGYLLQKIRERRGASDVSLVGVDLNEAELAVARERAVHEAVFVRADATDLPFAERRFDLVLCHMAFMLFDDPDAVATQIFNVLKPGGTFALILGDGSSPDGARRRFIDLVKVAVARFGGACPGLGTRQSRNIKELSALLEHAGFETQHLAPLPVAIEGSPREVFTTLRLMYNFEALTDEGRAYVEHAYFENPADPGELEGYRVSLIHGVFEKPPGG